ncbi:hypothetical protein P12x_000385 [Tundrisphaera lichenicola]|uniref:hypothetical protein n=1 Tax=Tundrisphaera lichenicola TaxID=2029860 RepID=UPI003EB9C7F4
MTTDLRRTPPGLLFAMVVAFGALVFYPCWLRLRNPTLYADDVVRLVQLQTRPLGSLLFRPFNEHMAPLFEAVTWTAWSLAGRRIANAPMALVLASFVPFAATLGLLGRVIRRELGSASTSLAAVAVMALASADGEVVNWYSASSFTWASAATLLAWLGALESCRAPDRRRLARWLFVSALGTFAAPAFCAIGLLAGPLAALRMVLDDRAGRHRRMLGALVPISGTIAYLALCECFRYRDVLATGLRQSVGVSTAIWNIGRAPVDILLPGLVGIRNLDPIFPDSIELSLCAILMLGLLAWAIVSRSHRGLILGGLALIVGGYAATYGVRTLPDPRRVIIVQRYHLFPQLGLVLLITPAIRAGLRRFDGRPVAMMAGVNALALVMLWAHLPQVKEHLRFFRFPEQPPTIAALDRLEAACRSRGITRDQILKALDPIRPTWVPSDGNALEMLSPSVAIHGRPTIEVDRLLASLSDADREALSGGMDASAHRIPPPSDHEGRPPSVARLVAQSRLRPSGPGHFESAGWPAYLEYRLGAEADDARALAVSDVRATRDVEFWWADVDGRWSPNRSAWWRPGPGQDWAVPLDRLPHWRKGHVRRLRVYFHEPGLVAIEAPRLIR